MLTFSRIINESVLIFRHGAYIVCLTKSGSHPHECQGGNVQMYAEAEADMVLALAVVFIEISVLTMPLSLVSADPAV